MAESVRWRFVAVSFEDVSFDGDNEMDDTVRLIRFRFEESVVGDSGERDD